MTMTRLTIENQFKKLQQQKDAIEKLEAALLDKEIKQSLQRIVAVIEKAVNAAHAIATKGAPAKRGRPPGTGKRGRPSGSGKAKRSIKLAGKKIPPIYRNPEDKSLTWSGRGRTPHWVAAMYEAGTLDQALIKRIRQ